MSATLHLSARDLAALGRVLSAGIVELAAALAVDTEGRRAHPGRRGAARRVARDDVKIATRIRDDIRREAVKPDIARPASPAARSQRLFATTDDLEATFADWADAIGHDDNPRAARALADLEAHLAILRATL